MLGQIAYNAYSLAKYDTPFVFTQYLLGIADNENINSHLFCVSILLTVLSALEY